MNILDKVKQLIGKEDSDIYEPIEPTNEQVTESNKQKLRNELMNFKTSEDVYYPEDNL